MAQTVLAIPSTADLARMSAIVADRARPLKHIQRALIVLLSAERLAVPDVARRTGISRPAVWHWQRCYAELGVEELAVTSSRPFEEHDAILEQMPIGVVHFPGGGISDNLADKALTKGIPVRRGVKPGAQRRAPPTTAEPREAGRGRCGSAAIVASEPCP